MADTGVFATTAEVQLWIPSWASATYNTETYINEFINAAESDVNNNDQFVNISDTYSGNNVDLKLTVHKLVCLKAAMAVVQKDISGTDIRVAEFWADWATNEINTCEKILKDKSIIKNIGASS